VRISYDPDVDALYIQLREGTPVDSVDIAGGVTADLDEQGRIIGFEVLDASEQLGNDGLTNIALERFPLEAVPVQKAS
jgi:uncharacterized protein YuzE